jgi:hypothetical protein
VSTARYLGCLGGLAVLCGVGAGVLTGCAVASADTGSADSSKSAASNSATGGSARSRTTKSSSTGAQASKSTTAASTTAASTTAASTTSSTQSTTSTGHSARGKKVATTGATDTTGSTDQTSTSTVTETATTGTTATQTTGTATESTASETANASKTTATATATDTATASLTAAVTAIETRLAATATALETNLTATATAVEASLNTAGSNLATTAELVTLALTTVVEAAFTAVVSVATFAQNSVSGVTTSLQLNGYNLVPSSTEVITSFYGSWTYLPGAPSLIQGEQSFDVVDPSTGETVGSFDALVSRGNGYPYTEILVTANDGTNVGTGAGQTPPVGSLIATFNVAGWGWTYTSMPTDSGDVNSFKIVTPFGDISIPLSFDAAEGIADHTVDNRAIGLGNGYYIAPADPDGENITGISGILPGYATVQGSQVFNIYDSDGNVVGSFEGVFTVTSDITGLYTEAIQVTSNDGTNVGTDAGQVPTVGTVYNVIYEGSDDNYVLYTSMPSESGDVISVIRVTPDGVTTVAEDYLDASSEPTGHSLSTPSGLVFVAASDLIVSGVNGLPPREVQVQGYQPFDIFDANGNLIGTVDADVSTQWDWLGIYSKAILVTNVVEGTDVPGVGSIFNFIYLGDTGFGLSYSVVATSSGDVTSLKIMTPVGDFTVFTFSREDPDRSSVDFYDPYVTV